MKAAAIILLLVSSMHISKGGNLSGKDSLLMLRGEWIFSHDSIDTSIGENRNASNYDGKYLLYDLLKFKNRTYDFKNNLSKEDCLFYEESGIFRIKNDSLFIKSRKNSAGYLYRIKKLSRDELIIEEILANDTLGVFRLIGFYKRRYN